MKGFRVYMVGIRLFLVYGFRCIGFRIWCTFGRQEACRLKCMLLHLVLEITLGITRLLSKEHLQSRLGLPRGL